MGSSFLLLVSLSIGSIPQVLMLSMISRSTSCSISSASSFVIASNSFGEIAVLGQILQSRLQTKSWHVKHAVLDNFCQIHRRHFGHLANRHYSDSHFPNCRGSRTTSRRSFLTLSLMTSSMWFW